MKTANLVASIEYNGSYHNGDFIAVDSGARQLISKSIEIKLVIGDMDSIDKASLDYINENKIDTIKLNPIKDATDLEAAIEYIQNDYDHINVYGALGKRVDHTLTNINILKKNPELVFYDDYSKIYVLKKGLHNIKENEYKYISMYPIKEGRITLDNFKYPLDNYLLKMDDSLCISNEKLKNATIKNTEDIIVIESR